jgi:hypothetical protein
MTMWRKEGLIVGLQIVLAWTHLWRRASASGWAVPSRYG